MTINQVNPSMQPTGKTPAETQDKIGGNDLFRQTLDKALEPDKESGTAMLPSSADTTPLREISVPGYCPIGMPSSQIQERTDKLLNMLDSYSSLLENPDISLKEIEPMLNDIKISAETLLKKTETTPEDSKLNGIAREAAMTASKEYLKFQRGDYL